jgi:hypothetical protein
VCALFFVGFMLLKRALFFVGFMLLKRALFSVVFCISLFILLSFSFGHCVFLHLDLQLLITPWVYSNSFWTCFHPEYALYIYICNQQSNNYQWHTMFCEYKKIVACVSTVGNLWVNVIFRLWKKNQRWRKCKQIKMFIPLKLEFCLHFKMW